MKNYTQLTENQRYQIYALLKNGCSQSEVAETIGCHKSTVSREIRRNSGRRGYRPKQAQEFCNERKVLSSTNAIKFTVSDWELVDRLINDDLSPEQVSGRLKLEKTLDICHETIYTHIYEDKRAGGDLNTHLRCQKKKRKRYKTGSDRRGAIKNRVSIDKRPKAVDKKSRIGDIEGDLIIGKNHKGAIATLVERKSKFLFAKKTNGKSAESVSMAVVALLITFKALIHTITFDNGKEFALHELISAKLGTAIYFCHPYHSWERGLNENTNGLLRQYFKKDSNLLTVSDEEVDQAVNRLNHRPRKSLGYKSPYEVFYKTKLSYTKS